MITPGLSRISRLLQNVPPLSWRAVHVAGTNGKGSVCSDASAMFGAAGVTHGRFTSPHLIDRWDCINLNGKPVQESLFCQVETDVKAGSRNIGASEFELLTATAFRLLEREKVQVGIVEVGMGGQDDATNVLQHPYVTVITKIGMDHQAFLGDSIEAIARHKAGIIKERVPCVIDGTNEQAVMNVVKQRAADLHAPLHVVGNASDVMAVLGMEPDSRLKHLENHQLMNLFLAFLAFDITMRSMGGQCYSRRHILDAALEVQWPGRLQYLDISGIIGKPQAILLDGAHNVQSAGVLGSYVDRRLRNENQRPVTWITALSEGKDIRQIFDAMMRTGDCIVVADFSPVDGMPWVNPAPTRKIEEAAAQMGIEVIQRTQEVSLQDILKLAVAKAQGGPVVVAGSLYLVSDVLKLMKSKGLWDPQLAKAM